MSEKITSLRFTEKERAMVKQFADKKKWNIITVIREALREYFEKYYDKIMK
jgi:hypothetical protein